MGNGKWRSTPPPARRGMASRRGTAGGTKVMKKINEKDVEILEKQKRDGKQERDCRGTKVTKTMMKKKQREQQGNIEEKPNKMEVNAVKKVNPLSPIRRAPRSAYQVPIF